MIHIVHNMGTVYTNNWAKIRFSNSTTGCKINDQYLSRNIVNNQMTGMIVFMQATFNINKPTLTSLCTDLN